MDHTFCLIKQLPILKLMDDKEVVEQYIEVLLDQETHAETPEHLGADQIVEPEDE